MRLLYVAANPKPIELSYSLQVASHFLDALARSRPDLTIERVDVYKDPIPLIDSSVFAAWAKLEKGVAPDEPEKAKLARMAELLEQFMAAEVYVFATPLWNLSYPPMLKAYIDNVVVAQRTFDYTPQGPVGLLKGLGKKAVHVQASGGSHSQGAMHEFGDGHLRGVLRFLGIEEYHHVIVEGLALDPSAAPAIVDAANVRAAEVARAIATAPPTTQH